MLKYQRNIRYELPPQMRKVFPFSFFSKRDLLVWPGGKVEEERRSHHGWPLFAHHHPARLSTTTTDYTVRLCARLASARTPA